MGRKLAWAFILVWRADNLDHTRKPNKGTLGKLFYTDIYSVTAHTYEIYDHTSSLNLHNVVVLPREIK